MSHEQSETIEDPETGGWVNVYGKKSGKKGRLPGTPTYPSVNTAVSAAKERSHVFGQLDPALLDQVSFEWDPTPLMPFVEQAATMDIMPQMNPAAMGDPAGGAMDMTGASSNPLGPQAKAGMDYNSIFGGAPAKGAGGAPIAGAAGLMMQPPAQQPMAPAAAPRRAPAMGRPPPGFPQMPQQGKIPTLAELLRGR